MKTAIKRLFIAVLVLSLTVGLVCVFAGCSKDETPVEKQFLKATESADGYATVYMPEDGDINIMVLSDPQVDVTEKYNAVGSLGNDKTYQFIEEFVAETDPDLVIINGDMVMFNTIGSSNVPYFKRYADIFEKLQIPWMPVFGNHDNEQGWCDATGTATPEDTKKALGKTALAAYLSSFDHCLMTSDEKCEDGDGNYFVNIRQRDGSLVYTLCAFDCVYNPDFGGILSGDSSYLETPTANQVDWYRDTVNALSDAEYGTDRTAEQVVKSMIFNHVAIPEFKAAWKAAWNNGNPTADYHYGVWLGGNSSDNYGEMPVEDQIFAAAKALGSTTAIFMCHHHDNDFSVDYQGIRLTFGQHSGVSHNYRTTHSKNGLTVSSWEGIDFSRIDNYGNQRGGTQVTIASDKSFEITPVYASEVLDDFATEFYIDYDAVAESLENGGKYKGTVKRGTDRKWKLQQGE